MNRFRIVCVLSFLFVSLCNAAEVIVIGAWDRARPVFERAAESRGDEVRFFSGSEADQLTVSNAVTAGVVLVLNLAAETTGGLRDTLLAAKVLRPDLLILPLDKRDSQKELEQAGLLTLDEEIGRYWRYSGTENLRRMLQYIAVRYRVASEEVLPPVVVPDFGIYHPRASNLFTRVQDYVQWSGADEQETSRVALLVQQSFIVTEDTQVFDAIINAFERHGISIATLFAASEQKLQSMLDQWHPNLLIDDAHAAPAAMQAAARFNIPHMKDISMLRATIAEWQASPLGLPFHDVSLHLLTQELYGIIDPVVVGGLKVNVGGYRIHEPIEERIERLVGRAAAWMSLRQKTNAEKKVAIVYYNKYLGQADLGRGSPSGAFLDGPESLVRLLHAMKAQGYTIDRLPKDAEELIGWMKAEGRNVGNWAPGDLAELVTNSTPEMVSMKIYEPWFLTLSDQNRAKIIEKHGEMPGNQMVWIENGRNYIILPKIDLGNVILMPQPARGPENNEELLHDRSIPPPHQYLAFYWWLQHGFQGDAIVHFGTHGSELLLPLKAAGLCKDDYGDICIGNMPNITPWIIDNAAEATLAKRRSYAVLVDHLTPVLEEAGLSSELRNLQQDIEHFQGLEEGLMKEKYRDSISEDAGSLDVLVEKRTETDRTDGTDGEWVERDGLLSDADIGELASVLHDIESQIAPMRLHTLGQPPAGSNLVDFVTSMLGPKFYEKLQNEPVTDENTGVLRQKAEALVEEWMVERSSGPFVMGEKTAQRTVLRSFLELAQDYEGRFEQTTNEIGYILHALDGEFVPPGPCNDPVRNPSALPTGRNMYAVNPEEIPTRQAWEVGVGLIDELLRTKTLKKVAFDLNAFETMRDYGVMQAQILYLMGVRPVWDANNIVANVEIIPKEELKRPRIDVFIAISGTMRDNFPSRVQLIDQAVKLVSEIDENDNFVRENTKKRENILRERLFSSEMAEKYANARIFGQKPGQYGTRILYLIPKSGSWEDEREVADVYIDNMSYVFTGDVWGERVEGLYEEAMQGSELVLRTWASNMLSPLSNHHVYEYAGGLSMAIETITGNEPELMLNDVRGEPKLRNFEDAIRVEMHATLLNKKWTRGMMENGYAGAGMMAELVKNTFGWKVTRPDSISNAMWDQIHDVYVNDKHELGLREWMTQENPHAFQEIAATLLEANRKNYWTADDGVIQKLAETYAQSVAEDGASGGLVGGGNLKLQQTVEQRLNAPGNQALLEAYQRELARSQGAPAPNRVAGPKMEKKTRIQTARDLDAMKYVAPLLLLTGSLILFLGYKRRMGSPS